MLRTRRVDGRIRFIALGMFVAVFLFVFLAQNFKSSDEFADAASLANFDPGYIISDWQMGNYNSMSEAEIQAFLTSKNPCSNRDHNYYLALSRNTAYKWHWENGHFVCLSEERFGDGEVIGSGETAARIIYRAAQDYRINPQALLVLLQKETSLVTDPIPNDGDYRKATGFGCPDTAPCSSEYYGFKNQVRKAAALFRIVLDGGWTNYPLGNNYVQYNPNPGCGGTVVNIRSLATSALYRYTPYQPNASVLAAGYGYGDGCGAYGNRNFYLYFEDWFGGVTATRIIPETPEIMKVFLNQNKGVLGREKTYLALEPDGRYWQLFENGTVVYHEAVGVHYILNGALNNKWAQYGGSLGALGRPRNDTKTEKDGRTWQAFENGTIIYHKNTGAHVVLNGAMNERWAEYGGSLGILGKPKNDTKREVDGRIWQTFENGTIVYRKDIGGWAVMNGEIADKWAVVKGSLGAIGVPIGDKKANSVWEWQDFEKGGIVYRIGSGFAISIQDNGIYDGWKKAVIEEGIDIGLPISMQFVENDGRHWQTYENGTIIFHKENGAFVVLNGKIHDEWAASGGSLGQYGRPISNQTLKNGMLSQKFLNGDIEIIEN